ncbi:DUF1365 domain-containing protein [Alcaligenes sp. PF14]|uniref:DUF1365 domain-containing protein n=1 Tax=Alcaligenes sp. PF14 TaxID=3120297 RepID=UPI0030160EDB
MNASALIGFGHIWHRRLRPVEHAFHYPGYFLLLPMRSLREHPVPVLRRNQRGWISFHDSDHGNGGNDALAWFESLLEQEGIEDADGEIWLHTFPRVLGYVFKPVSFWYAHRADGSLAAILAEVNNTFGERHAYLLAGPHLGWDCEQVASKQFHVSPFCETHGEYRFRFSRDETTNLALVDLYDDAGPLLRTGVQGTLHPLNAATVRRAFFGTPLMTLGVIVRIHWQALRLWAKRLPFHRKPPAPKRSVTR